MLALLNIGFFEMVLLAAAAVLLFGGDLPDVARKAARFVSKVRALSNDLTRELNTGDQLRRPPGLSRPPELDRPAELDLGRDERQLLGGKLTERPRPPFTQGADSTADAELGPPRTPADPLAPRPSAPADGELAPARTPADPLAPRSSEPADGGQGSSQVEQPAGDTAAAATPPTPPPVQLDPPTSPAGDDTTKPAADDDG